MNIVELAAAVAVDAKLTKTEAETVVRVVFDKISESLAKGEEVKIAGFGSFAVKNRAARTGLNPATKQPIQIPASKVVGFKAAKHIKDTLN